MNAALNAADKALKLNETPVGCVIVKNGEIISTGYNKRETEKNSLMHAEIEAIDKACKALGGWRLHECDLYVTLEPCPMCAGAIINSRIKNVYFGAYDLKNGCFGSVTDFSKLPFNHKPCVTGGILEKECSELLSDFFTTLRMNKEKNSNRQFKIGIIGCGSVSRTHIEAILSDNLGEIIGICDTSQKKLDEIKLLVPNAKTYNNYKELLCNPFINIVHICSPPSLRPEMTINAMKAGKDVCLENSDDNNLEDILKIIQTSDKSRKKVCLSNVSNDSKMIMISNFYEALRGTDTYFCDIINTNTLR